jgi:phosphatidylglycerophosphate synthase
VIAALAARIDSDGIITSFIDCGSKRPSSFGAKMRTIIKCSAIILTLAAVTPANAKGCLKGALVGGVAGHYTVHHGLLGAATGCIIGRHEAKKRAQMEREKREHPIPGNGEEHL